MIRHDAACYADADYFFMPADAAAAMDVAYELFFCFRARFIRYHDTLRHHTRRLSGDKRVLRRLRRVTHAPCAAAAAMPCLRSTIAEGSIIDATCCCHFLRCYMLMAGYDDIIDVIYATPYFIADDMLRWPLITADVIIVLMPYIFILLRRCFSLLISPPFIVSSRACCHALLRYFIDAFFRHFYAAICRRRRYHFWTLMFTPPPPPPPTCLCFCFAYVYFTIIDMLP